MFLSYGCPYDLKRSCYEDFSFMCDFFEDRPTGVDRGTGKRTISAMERETGNALHISPALL